MVGVGIRCGGAVNPAAYAAAAARKGVNSEESIFEYMDGYRLGPGRVGSLSLFGFDRPPPYYSTTAARHRLSVCPFSCHKNTVGPLRLTPTVRCGYSYSGCSGGSCGFYSCVDLPLTDRIQLPPPPLPLPQERGRKLKWTTPQLGPPPPPPMPTNTVTS